MCLNERVLAEVVSVYTVCVCVDVHVPALVLTINIRERLEGINATSNYCSSVCILSLFTSLYSLFLFLLHTRVTACPFLSPPFSSKLSVTRGFSLAFFIKIDVV